MRPRPGEGRQIYIDHCPRYRKSTGSVNRRALLRWQGVAAVLAPCQKSSAFFSRKRLYTAYSAARDNELAGELMEDGWCG